MRDRRTLAERIAADLATVNWPTAAEIRARARRRTRRTMLAVPAMVVLVVIAVWTGAGVLGRGAQRPMPVPPAATADPTPAPTETASHRSAELDDIIQLDALLQPSDVGADYQFNTNSQYRYDPGENQSWMFHLEGCPGYTRLGVTTWRGYLYQVGYRHTRKGDETGDKDIAVQAERYPGRDAAQLVADVRRVVAACPEYTVEESEPSSAKGYVDTRITYELLDTGFAGDSSVLVRSVAVPVLRTTGQVYGGTNVTMIAVVQVRDLVGMVYSHDITPRELITLAQRAVPRLCTAAKPRC